MAQQLITGGNGSSGQTGEQIKNIINENFEEVYNSIENTTEVLVTGTQVLDSTAFGKWHHCSGTSADYTVTLPTAVGNKGKMILFCGDPDVSVLSKLVTIEGDGTEKIGNSLNYAITTKGHLTLIARVTAGVGSWDIVNYDQGEFYAFDPGWTGFSVNPIGPYLYKRGLGYLDLSFYTMTAGTGTGTTVTFNLPLGFTPKVHHRLLTPYYINNNLAATVPGIIIAAAGTNTVQVWTSVAAGPWSGSNNRSVYGSWRIAINE